jgi:hypothetical protein
MKALVKMINKGNTAKAFDKFVTDVEVDDLLQFIETVEDDDTVTILTDFIKQYEKGNDSYVAPKLTKRRKRAGNKSEYYEKGRLSLLDRYLDEVFEAYDCDEHYNNRYRLPYDSDAIARAKYLADYWAGAVDFYAYDGDHGRFTQGIRHQICQLTKGNNRVRKSLLKNIPTASECEEMYE